jgi:ABC-type molybdenum transport system ATPase subunit/photorepair protein PhrA
LDLKYSVCLSHDAIERGREEEERRLAAEEQARELFGYALTSETKTETLNHPTKQGAIFDLIGSSAWTRLAGARTSAGNVLGDNGGLNGQSPSRNSNHFDGHVGAIQMEEINKSLIEKTILNGISSYFNPGQMVAIMGPSGSGKTTFLDLMTGRRREGRQTVKHFLIFVFVTHYVYNVLGRSVD